MNLNKDDSSQVVICPCTGATEEKIREDIIRLNGALDKFKVETSVATHCTGCLPAVMEIYDEALQRGDLSKVSQKKTGLLNWFRFSKIKNQLRRFTNFQRYALFVVRTPMAQSRVSCSNLSPLESSYRAKKVYLKGELFDREGKRLKKFFFTIPPNHTKTIQISDHLDSSSEPFYGLLKLTMRGSAVVGSTRPYGFWETPQAISSTHDKFSDHKDPGWQHTLVFVEVAPDYDTDLVLCNPHSKVYTSRVWLLDDSGQRLDLGMVTIPAFGTTMVCPLALNPESAKFLAGRRGSLLLENENDPIMSYYLGHDYLKNRWLIQHL